MRNQLRECQWASLRLATGLSDSIAVRLRASRMSKRLSVALDSVLNDADAPLRLPPLRFSKTLKSLTKRRTNEEYDSNTTIKYFRGISNRRIKASKNDLVDTQRSVYRPFDRNQLYYRIGTFRKVTNWNIRHDLLTPLIMALSGWECDNRKLNTLVCCCCKEAVLITLPGLKYTEDGEEDAIENELIDKVAEKYITQLTEFHRENCPWRKQTTPMNVYEITLSNLNNEVKWFKESYFHNSNFLDTKLDGFKLESVLDDEAREAIGYWLKEHNLPVDNKLIEITVLGWTFEHQGPSLLLVSPSDGRRVIPSGTLNLLSEHHRWSSYVKGYHTLIQIFKALMKKPPAEPEAPTDESLEPSDDCSERVEASEYTVERLEALRKVYFD